MKIQQNQKKIVTEKNTMGNSAKTFIGIAKAFATQYTAFINSKRTVLEWENSLKGLDISRSNAIIDSFVVTCKPCGRFEVRFEGNCTNEPG